MKENTLQKEVVTALRQELLEDTYTVLPGIYCVGAYNVKDLFF